MSENIFFAAFFFPSAAAVIIFGMKYVAAIMEAKVRLKQDDAYRDIAAKAAAAQAETAATLAQVLARLAGLEKVLKEVE
jgi:epoxyqueuosine reductase QueG